MSDNFDKTIEGLELSYKRLIKFKKYKNTPIIVCRDGKVVEIQPEQINTDKNVYITNK